MGSLVIAGHLSVTQGLANFCSQMSGTLIGAFILMGMHGDCTVDVTHTLGSNVRDPKVSVGEAFLGEFIMTFCLVYVVYETAVNKRFHALPNACLARGFAVFTSHLVLFNMTGCSINPTRSFGPLVVATIRGGCEQDVQAAWDDHWIFWVAPLTGSFCATCVQHVMLHVTLPGDKTSMNELMKPLDKDKEVRDMAIRCFDLVDVDEIGEITEEQTMGSWSNDTVVRAHFASLGLSHVEPSALFKTGQVEAAQRMDREAFIASCLKLRGWAKSSDMVECLQMLRKPGVLLPETNKVMESQQGSRPLEEPRNDLAEVDVESLRAPIL